MNNKHSLSDDYSQLNSLELKFIEHDVVIPKHYEKRSLIKPEIIGNEF